MNINLTFTFAIGALAGSIIGFLGSILSVYLTKKSEEKRQIRELGFRVAIAKFEQQGEMVKWLSAYDGVKIEIQKMPTFEQFLTYGIKIAEAVSVGSRSAEELGRIISESDDFSRAVTKAIKIENAHQQENK